MLKKIILLVFISSFWISTNAQNETKHHIGFSYGTTTGYGLSYRFWPKKLGVQITTLPIIKSGNFQFGIKKSLNIGISGLYTLKDNKFVDLYTYLGNVITLEEYYGDFPPYSTTQPRYNIGVGLGMKFEFLQDLNFNIQYGYGLYNIASEYLYTDFTGEIGLYYQL